MNAKTFTEDATGLIWDQCNAHTMTEFCVTGSIDGYDNFKELSPDEALSWATTSNANGHYGYADWCVPNLSTLRNLYANTQNTFPGYPGMGWLMTSTPAPVGAYQVLMDRTAYGNSSAFVRLVRSTVYFGPNAVCDVRVGAAIPTLGATTSNLVVSPTNGGQGVGYWLGVTDRMRVPTAAEVRAGIDYDNEAGGVQVGSARVPAGSVTTNIPVPRSYGTLPFRYDLHHMYFVMEDSQGNLSSVVGPISNSSLLIQTTNFDTPNDTREGTDVVLRATASSGKTVSLRSDTPAVCSVNAGIARALQSGVCTVSARVPNDGVYSAAPKVSRSFTFLPKTAQNISFGAAPALQVGAASATLSATGGASGNAVTFSTGSATCSLSGANNSVVRGVAVGSCLVQANQAGDANYNAASPVIQTIAVGKGSQSIGFGTVPTLQVGGATAILSATGGATGNPVTFSTSSAACSLSGVNNSVVRGLAVGSCLVQADQTGDVNYNAASPVTQTIAVGKGSQSIGFGTVPTLQVGGATAMLSATGGATGNPVTFSTSSAACSLSGANNSVVRGVAVGSCLVQADQTGDVNYNAASPVTQTIAVGKGSQSIGFGTVPTLQVGGATAMLSATGGATGNPVTFSTSSAACSLSGANNSVVRGVAVGSCTVQANQAGDANYNAASPVTQTIAVGKGSQNIGFGAIPALQVGATGTLGATGGGSVSAVTFSTSSAACSLSGANNSVVRGVAVGSCLVQADQAGDANYNAASPVTQTIAVGKGSQSIGFGAVPTLQVGATGTLGATGGGSVSAVTFSTSSAACSLSGANNSVVRGVAAGSCTVQADQPGDANYNAASPVTQTIAVGKGSQSIGFGAIPALQVGATGTLGATGGGSVSAVTFSTSSATCSLSGANNSVVRALVAGTCTVQANQAGDANYNAASPVTQTIAIGKGSQSIGFGTAPTLQVGGATAMLSATGGATGNPVTFSTSSAACSLSGANNSVVKALVAGSCTVQADQAGDANYNAASPATNTFPVAPATPGSLSYTGSTPAIAATNFSHAVAAGTAQVAISGGTDAGCGFASAQFVAPRDISGALPVGYQAAAAGFQFSSSYCGNAASIQIAITYPQALPTDMVLYKWGPAVAGAAPSWFAYPGVTMSADRKTLRYSITDGGVGDANPANGYVSDPVFVAVPNAPPVAVPGLGVWALLMLSSGVLLLGFRQSRGSA